MKDLPCPKPLVEAVEAGYFGRCADGSLTPSTEEVQSITREHVLRLIALRLEMEQFTRAMQTGASSTSGKIPKSRERQEANRQVAGRLRKEPQVTYLGGLAAYETAFGREAVDQLMRYIDEELKHRTQSLDRADRQLDLF